MKHGTLMVLLNFTPKNNKINHPFWIKNFKKRKNTEQMGIKLNKLKKLEENYKYFKDNWRFHKEIITDFYSYLKFNFPNAIPFSLFFPCEDKYLGARTERKIAGLADKWLTDILSGESFYEKNKDYFTKTEAKYFLSNSYWVEPDIISFKQSSYKNLLQHYWEAKIRANELELSLDFFVNRFINITERYVQEFFLFICRNKKYAINENEISDIWDFFKNENKLDFGNMTWQQLRCLILEQPEEFFKRRFDPNNFKNAQVQEFFRFICRNKKYVKNEYEVSDIWDFLRHNNEIVYYEMSWYQLSCLSEEWHYDFPIHYYYPTVEEMKNKVWEKTTIIDYLHIIDDKVWTITEITTGKLLYEEGDDMHHCVFSYLDRCISRQCAIFSVKVNDKRIATLEIDLSNLNLVQARGKMNAPVNINTKNIIMTWAKENNIKLIDYIFN